MSTSTLPPFRECTKCHQLFPSTKDYFYGDKSKRGGLDTRCKICCSEQKRNMSPELRQKDRDRRKRWRANNRQQHRNSVQQWKRDNPKKRQVATVRYRKKYPEKQRAHKAVTRAIELGKLARASNMICERCYKQAREYHHPDYSKPLDVIAVCRDCHNTIHREQTKAGR